MTDNNHEIIQLINERFNIGRETYGHGLRINDDTRQWNTQMDRWEDMALEELLDGMVYITCEILRKRRDNYEYRANKIVGNDRENFGIVKEFIMKLDICIFEHIIQICDPKISFKCYYYVEENINDDNLLGLMRDRLMKMNIEKIEKYI